MYDGFIVKDYMRNSLMYNGTYSKFGIDVDGQKYIVKLEKRQGQSSCISECLVSRLINRLGIPAHQTWLGYYNNDLVAILKDFTDGIDELKTFGETGQSSENTDLSSKSYTYKDVVYLISQHTKLKPENKNLALIQFWNMFFCDALFGNRDRHRNNWGYINSSNGWSMAPIFDNGGSLFSEVHKVIDTFSLSNKEFLIERCETFPASVFCVKDSDRVRRSNFYEEIGNIQSGIEHELLISFKQKLINFEETVFEELNCISRFLPAKYYDFYFAIILMRMYHIIFRYDFDESYEKTISVINRYTSAYNNTSLF